MSAAVKLRRPARNRKVLAITDSNKATSSTGENKAVLFTISQDEGRFHTVMGDNVRNLNCVRFAVTFQRCIEIAADGARRVFLAATSERTEISA